MAPGPTSAAADPRRSARRRRAAGLRRTAPREHRHLGRVRVLGRRWAQRGGLFWLVALGIGLISIIQYRGVRERLAECLPGIRSCSTEVWVANELPWVLALGSALALLMLGVVLRRTP